MISRRGFITGFVTGLTPLAATASAQEYKAGKIPRIGMLLQVLEPAVPQIRQMNVAGSSALM